MVFLNFSCYHFTVFKENESAFDIWSIPHFLSGIIIGIPSLSRGYSFAESLAILIVLSLLFECIEIFFVFHESFTHKIVDLALGIAAFILGYFIFTKSDGKYIDLIMLFSVCVYMLIVIPGWIKDIVAKLSKNNIHESKA